MTEKEFVLNADSKNSLYEFVQEQLKDLDTTELSDDVSDEVKTDITESKVYFWTRVYLREENPNIEVGDYVTIKWTPSGEELKTQFITYGKDGLEKDQDEELVNYNPEYDKKVLCLMIEESVINNSEDIPFIRTLFKLGRHYEYQLVRRDELVFSIDKNGILLDYYDTDF